VRHGAVDFEEDAFTGIGGGEGEAFPIPADALIGQLAGLAGEILVERAGDGPVVRECEGGPAGVVEAGLHKGNARAGLGLVGGARGARRGDGEQLGAGGHDPVANLRVGEGGTGIGRIAAVEAPAIVEEQALARNGGFGREGERGENRTQAECEESSE